MKNWDKKFKAEAYLIKQERQHYPLSIKGEDDYVLKLFEYLSVIFLGIGFLSLILTFFTKITLVQATCFFVISGILLFNRHMLENTDGERYEEIIKGIAEDMGNIRASIFVIGKNINLKE